MKLTRRQREVLTVLKEDENARIVVSSLPGWPILQGDGFRAAYLRHSTVFTLQSARYITSDVVPISRARPLGKKLKKILISLNSQYITDRP